MKCTKAYRLSFTEQAKALVAQMSLEEKIFFMSGWVGTPLEAPTPERKEDRHYNFEPYGAGGNERLGIEPMKFCDGPRGVVCGTGKTTCFPVSMCRGASFDPALEEEIGHAIGREVLASGGNLFAGVCINLPYHPAWGRSQETYGEDSFAIGQMGAALTRGVQAENVIACVKHFAFNSMEISRFKVSVDCTRRTEREVYLSHFKDCIDAGAASVMSAYNRYQGIYCGHHAYLLRKVLKEEWDFDGFVMSDFIHGVKDTVEAANGGQDMEMCWTHYFGEKLVEAVRAGSVPEARIDDAAVRIVRTLLAFQTARSEAKPYGAEVLGCDEHIRLSHKAAVEGITLLKNEAVLPLDAARLKTLTVVGKLAEKTNIGDYGSSRVHPRYIITPMQALGQFAPDTEIRFFDGSDIEAARASVRCSDAVLYVVGCDHGDEGEFIVPDDLDDVNRFESLGGDRKDGIGLHEDELKLLKALLPENRNSIVTLMGGNTLLVNPWFRDAGAVIMAYYPGQEGGSALCELLFGLENFSGKLPFVLPEAESDLPSVNWDSENQWYDYYHGYAKLDHNGVKPLLPYGFGLSYTEFRCSDADFTVKDGAIQASCTLKNIGQRDGTEVMQLYIGFAHSAFERPVKLLRGFRRVSVPAGGSIRVTLCCPIEKLAFYNEQTAHFEVEDMAYEVMIGTSSDESSLQTGIVSLRSSSLCP